jgi:hypothetical protein
MDRSLLNVYLAGEGVLGLRSERIDGAAVAPRACPLVWQRVELGHVLRLLVHDQRAVGRAVGGALPPRAPVDLVAAQEGEVHAAVAGGRHAAPLLAAPILVVPDAQVDGVRGRGGETGCIPIGIDARPVADLCTRGLEPSCLWVSSCLWLSSRRASS